MSGHRRAGVWISSHCPTHGTGTRTHFLSHCTVRGYFSRRNLTNTSIHSFLKGCGFDGVFGKSLLQCFVRFLFHLGCNRSFGIVCPLARVLVVGQQRVHVVWPPKHGPFQTIVFDFTVDLHANLVTKKRHHPRVVWQCGSSDRLYLVSNVFHVGSKRFGAVAHTLAVFRDHDAPLCFLQRRGIVSSTGIAGIAGRGVVRGLDRSKSGRSYRVSRPFFHHVQEQRLFLELCTVQFSSCLHVFFVHRAKHGQPRQHGAFVVEKVQDVLVSGCRRSTEP